MKKSLVQRGPAGKKFPDTEATARKVDILTQPEDAFHDFERQLFFQDGGPGPSLISRFLFDFLGYTQAGQALLVTSTPSLAANFYGRQLHFENAGWWLVSPSELCTKYVNISLPPPPT